MLHERAHDRRSSFGPQRQAAAAAVDEVVHLLAHHIGRLTDAREHFVVLDDRRQQQPEAEPLRTRREPGDEVDPPRRLGRQDVEHALGRAHDVSVR